MKETIFIDQRPYTNNRLLECGFSKPRKLKPTKTMKIIEKMLERVTSK